MSHAGRRVCPAETLELLVLAVELVLPTSATLLRLDDGADEGGRILERTLEKVRSRVRSSLT